jgi:hypothetical protein
MRGELFGINLAMQRYIDQVANLVYYNFYVTKFFSKFFPSWKRIKARRNKPTPWFLCLSRQVAAQRTEPSSMIREPGRGEAKRRGGVAATGSGRVISSGGPGGRGRARGGGDPHGRAPPGPGPAAAPARRPARARARPAPGPAAPPGPGVGPARAQAALLLARAAARLAPRRAPAAPPQRGRAGPPLRGSLRRGRGRPAGHRDARQHPQARRGHRDRRHHLRRRLAADRSPGSRTRGASARPSWPSAGSGASSGLWRRGGVEVAWSAGGRAGGQVL